MPDFLIVLNNKKRCFLFEGLSSCPSACITGNGRAYSSISEHQQSHTGPLQNVHFPQGINNVKVLPFPRVLSKFTVP